MKIAILGGSFDPVHLGHLFLLHSASQLTDYDKFLLIPAALSNFKQEKKPVASASQRLEMLKLALLDYKDLYPTDSKEVLIDQIELLREGVSYTYETVVNLRQKYNTDQRIGLIIGDDHIQKLRSWYKFDELKDLVQFVICPRSNDQKLWDMLDSQINFIRLNPETLAGQSSSAFRVDSKANLSYLSKRVQDYVQENNLYA